MVDRGRILALVDVIERHVRHLDDMTPRAFTEYAADVRTRLAVERAVQVAIEAMLDAAALVAAGKRAGLPADEETVGIALVRSGCFEEAEARLFQDLRKFRNVLVHQYGKLDDERVHRHALDAPEALGRLVAALRRCLG